MKGSRGQCPVCRKVFKKIKNKQVFCSRKCYRVIKKIKETEKQKDLLGKEKTWEEWVWVRANHQSTNFTHTLEWKQKNPWKAKIKSWQGIIRKLGHTPVPKQKEYFDLLERQKYRCALTGDELTPKGAEQDHIIPVKHGGTSDIGNLQIVLRNINRMKGTISQEEFIGLCYKVVKHHRDKQHATKTKTTRRTR